MSTDHRRTDLPNFLAISKEPVLTVITSNTCRPLDTFSRQIEYRWKAALVDRIDVTRYIQNVQQDEFDMLGRHTRTLNNVSANHALTHEHI